MPKGGFLEQITPSVTLSNLAVSYTSVQRKRFIADRVCPIFPVDLTAGDWIRYEKKDAYHEIGTVIGVDGKVSEVSEKAAKVTYVTEDYGLARFTSKTEGSAIIASGGNPSLRAVNLIMAKLMLAREARVANLLFTSSNYASSNTSSIAAGLEWDDATPGNPLTQLETARAAVIGGSRLVAVFGYAAWAAFKTNDFVIERFKNTTGGITTKEAAAQLIEVDEVIVGEAETDTANIGSSTLTRSRLWGDKVAILAVPASPLADEEEPLFAATLRLNDNGFTMQAMEEEIQTGRGRNGGLMTQIGYAEDLQILSNVSGYLLENCAA